MERQETASVTARNLGWNYVGHFADALLGFALVAFIARHIGIADYGLYLLSFAVAGILLIALDGGIAAVLSRAIVDRLTNDSIEAANGLLGAAVMAALAAGSLAFILCAAVPRVWSNPFGVDASLVPDAERLITFVGAYVAPMLVASTIESAYRACHHFEDLNRIQIAASVTRLAATVIAISAGYGIVMLAAIQVAIASTRAALLWVLLGRVRKGLHVGIARVDWRGLAGLWKDSRWALLENFNRHLALQAGPVILGLFASTSVVAIYSVASRPASHLWTLVGKGVAVAMPVMADHHVSSRATQVGHVFLASCRHTFALAAPIILLFALFADWIIDFWVGASYAQGATVLRWLALASLAQALSSPCYGCLYAIDKVAIAAKISFIESFTFLALAFALAGPYGATGIAAASAVTHFVGTWFLYMPATCRLTGIAPRRVILDIVKAIAAPIAAMILAVSLTWLAMNGAALSTRTVAAVVAGLVVYAAMWLRLSRLNPA